MYTHLRRCICIKNFYWRCWTINTRLLKSLLCNWPPDPQFIVRTLRRGLQSHKATKFVFWTAIQIWNPSAKTRAKRWAEGVCVSCALIVGGGTDLEKCANFWAGRTFESFCWVALSNAIKVEIDGDAIVCRNANLFHKNIIHGIYVWINLEAMYQKLIFVHINTKEYLDTIKFLLEYWNVHHTKNKIGTPKWSVASYRGGGGGGGSLNPPSSLFFPLNALISLIDRSFNPGPHDHSRSSQGNGLQTPTVRKVLSYSE